MIIFFVYEAVRVVLNLLAYNKEKALEEAKLAVDSAELTEEQKKRAIEEGLLGKILPPSEKIRTRRKMSPMYKHLLTAIIPLIIPIKL